MLVLFFFVCNTRVQSSGKTLQEEIAKASDLNATLQIKGINFPVVIKNALRGDIYSLKLLFWVSNNIEFDSSASAGFSYYLVQVAEIIGDEKLSKTLRGVEGVKWDTTRFYFRYEFSDPELTPAKVDIAIAKKFPRLWELIAEK